MSERSIRSLLIANRGEIAVRIMATCRAMGIRTVSVFSEVDANLPHAWQADEAYPLGMGTLAETYLHQDKLIEIALRAGVDAVHPGYGFLSENAEFAQKVLAAGLLWVGPPADCIRDMGDKIAAREAALRAGVPIVPGYDGEEQTAERLQKEAEKIGYPVMIKASAGGGGKGMRIVQQPVAFGEALAQAKSEARNAFGDDRVFLEKYITSPRHIEVQVFSDTQGNHVHLFERECSIQRRHQKIVEESPSTAVDAATRAKITSEAVALARQIGYVGAGTVEFIMEPSGTLYFLEMNTRLQVEHPVTEGITGLDLVRWQLEVAMGKPLPLRQDEIHARGHAVEVRLYAENPEQGHLPSTGQLQHVGEPKLRGLRLDSGYAAGNDVTMHYDPMLAKMIGTGATREDAIRCVCAGLRQVSFAGVKTNRAYLLQILQHEAFMRGETYTSFLETYGDELQLPQPDVDAQAVAVAAFLLAGNDGSNASARGMGATISAAGDAQVAVWEQGKIRGFRNA